MSDENFSRIKIEDFYSAQAVLFDIYIKLKENKYLKILHTGDTFSKDRIDKYKNEKKIDSLYFHNSDRRKYIQYNNHLASKFISNASIPGLNKVNIVKKCFREISRRSFYSGA